MDGTQTKHQPGFVLSSRV